MIFFKKIGWKFIGRRHARKRRTESERKRLGGFAWKWERLGKKTFSWRPLFIKFSYHEEDFPAQSRPPYIGELCASYYYDATFSAPTRLYPLLLFRVGWTFSWENFSQASGFFSPADGRAGCVSILATMRSFNTRAAPVPTICFSFCAFSALGKIMNDWALCWIDPISAGVFFGAIIDQVVVVVDRAGGVLFMYRDGTFRPARPYIKDKWRIEWCTTGFRKDFTPRWHLEIDVHLGVRWMTYSTSTFSARPLSKIEVNSLIVRWPPLSPTL